MRFSPNENCISKATEYLSNLLQRDVKIERAHRDGRAPTGEDRHVLVKCSFYLDKCSILVKSYWSFYYYIIIILVVWFECRFLVTEVDASNPGNSMLFPWARYFFCIASVDSAVKWVPGGDNFAMDVQCYELFGGITLKSHAFSFFFHFHSSNGKGIVKK